MTKGDEDELGTKLIPDIKRIAENYNLLADEKIKVVSDFTCLKKDFLV